MNAKPPEKKGWSGKSLVIIALVILGCAGGAWFVVSNPPAWFFKWRVTRYLKTHSYARDFAVKFPFPSKAEMARKPEKPKEPGMTVGPLTKRDFDTLKDQYINIKLLGYHLERHLADQQGATNTPTATNVTTGTTATNAPPARTNRFNSATHVAELQKDYSAREKDLPMIESDLWAFQRYWALHPPPEAAPNSGLVAWQEFTDKSRQTLDGATTYAAMYEVIGKQLWIANRYLASANPDHQRFALGIVLEAMRDTERYIQNDWLVAQIAEAYILPYLDAGLQASGRSAVSVDNLIRECADAFRNIDDRVGVLRVYQVALAKATEPRKDSMRMQLSNAYEQVGELQQALQQMRQIKSTNAWTARRVAYLERVIANK